ncbi:MAG: DNA polymerase III subunit delta [Lachnospiraceae bacterium]|jgi:DNA polymerase-3 subunit delta|nr:DNA polymerase III subunit delta [Lachnospiraceae bacterium]
MRYNEIRAAEAELNKDIKEQTFRPVYLFFGEEDFMVRFYYGKLCKALGADPEDMNTSIFREGADSEEILDALHTMPFFAERRIVILKDTGLAKSGGSFLAKYLEKPCDTAVLVMRERDEKLDERTKLLVTIAQKGVMLQCKKQTPEYLQKNVGAFLKKYDKRATLETVKYLLAQNGDSMTRLFNELEKITSYVGDRQEITREDVDAICSKSMEEKIFGLLDAVTDGKRTRALDIYYELIQQKTEPMMILTMLEKQLLNVLRVKCMREEGMLGSNVRQRMVIRKKNPNKDEQKKIEDADADAFWGLGAEPRFLDFQVENMLERANNSSRAALQRAIGMCARADEDIKTGRLSEQIAVEMLLLRLTGG